MNGLGRDNTYYLKCDNPPAPNSTEVAPVNLKYVSGAFKWRNVPGEQSKYGIELLPAPGLHVVLDHRPVLDDRLRGQHAPAHHGQAREARRARSWRRCGARTSSTSSTSPTSRRSTRTRTDDVTTATANCANFRDQRASYCSHRDPVRDDDEVLGPMHTNDNIRVCGSTAVRRNSRDKIEINGPTPYVYGGQLQRQPELHGHARASGRPARHAALKRGARTSPRDLSLLGQDEINLTTRP